MILEANGVDVLNEDISIINFFKSVFSYSSKSDVEKAKVEYSKSIETAEKELAAKGLDVGKVKNLAEQKASKIASLIKSQNLSEAASDKISEIASETSKSFLEVFTSLYDDLGDSEGVASGLIVFIIVLVVNSVAMMLLAQFMPVQHAMFCLAVFVAPFTEEMARREVIQRGSGLGAFTVLINAYEFLNYTTMMVRAGVSVLTAVTMRATVALLHHTLGVLQKWGYLKDIDLGISKEDAGRLQFVLAVLLHAANNAFGGLFWKAVFPKAFKEAVLVEDEVFFV